MNTSLHNIYYATHALESDRGTVRFTQGDLNIIEHDYHKAVPCCNAMLEEWLDKGQHCHLGRGRLLSALHSIAVSLWRKVILCL